MKFAVFSVVDHYPAELDRTVEAFYAELLEQAEAAEQLGFDSFWIAEHHFHEYGAVPRPPIWMAAAAARTRRIRLGAAVVVLPFDHPLRVAEDYAMVDLLSGGRLELGVGSGYLKHEYDGFGIDAGEKHERFEEELEVLLRAWAGEAVTFSGKFHEVKQVRLNVRPLQRPRPPIAIATLGAERAAEIGAGGFGMMLIPYATTEHVGELGQAAERYRHGREQAGIAGRGAVWFALHAHCADSIEEARREAREPLDRYVRTRLYARRRSLDALVERDLVAFGDPAEIVRIAERYEQAGLDHFLLILNFGGMEHRRVLRSLERIAEGVLPRFA